MYLQKCSHITLGSLYSPLVNTSSVFIPTKQKVICTIGAIKQYIQIQNWKVLEPEVLKNDTYKIILIIPREKNVLTKMFSYNPGILVFAFGK